MGIITDALLFIGPAYFANAAPLVLGGGRTIDNGHVFFDGQPIFGSHKTVRGFVAGIAAGTIVGVAESISNPKLGLAGFFIAIGAVFGDLIGAFLKRRLSIEPGRSFPFLDQLDFVLGGLFFGYIFFPISIWSILIVVFVTPPIHLGTNYAAYFLGLKKTRY
jgi:CDP-2,3-bis-(O-geranylgeranyl)-sn-glycerol synthase